MIKQMESRLVMMNMQGILGIYELSYSPSNLELLPTEVLNRLMLFVDNARGETIDMYM